MATHNAKYKRQKFAAVIPLLCVIGAALVWSAFATFQHAEGPNVPGSVAWTLVVALDGTVVVTTPVWLSTVLPAKVRNYAALICIGALGGSMAINYSETSWPGVFPPLIAGALIHLVGVVLRAFARLERDAESAEDVGVDAESVVESASEDAVPDVAASPVLPEVEQVETLAPRPPAVSLLRKPSSAADVAKAMLNAAYSRDEPLPGGAEITAACRAAGFEVNDNYGRSFKSRWTTQHPGAREAVQV